MGLINWDEEYQLGIKSIDSQHKKLVDIINKLHNGLMEGEGSNLIGKILSELIEYTVFHFKFEEDLFDRFDFEDKENHKRIHQELVQQVENFNYKYKSGDITITLDLMDFLKGWLLNHIRIEDKKYVEFFNEHNIK